MVIEKSLKMWIFKAQKSEDKFLTLDLKIIILGGLLHDFWMSVRNSEFLCISIWIKILSVINHDGIYDAAFQDMSSEELITAQKKQ